MSAYLPQVLPNPRRNEQAELTAVCHIFLFQASIYDMTTSCVIFDTPRSAAFLLPTNSDSRCCANHYEHGGQGFRLDGSYRWRHLVVHSHPYGVLGGPSSPH